LPYVLFTIDIKTGRIALIIDDTERRIIQLNLFMFCEQVDSIRINGNQPWEAAIRRFW